MSLHYCSSWLNTHAPLYPTTVLHAHTETCFFYGLHVYLRWILDHIFYTLMLKAYDLHSTGLSFECSIEETSYGHDKSEFKKCPSRTSAQTKKDGFINHDPHQNISCSLLSKMHEAAYTALWVQEQCHQDEPVFQLAIQSRKKSSVPLEGACVLRLM